MQTLFSNWLSKNYLPVEQGRLRGCTKATLHVFFKEEVVGSLGLFNEVSDHVPRMDRTIRQPQDHLMLLEVSGAGGASTRAARPCGQERQGHQECQEHPECRE